MKSSLKIFLILLLFSTACINEEFSKEIPDCIKDKIEEIKGEAVWSPPAKIYRYQYNGETVYYIPPRCCDIMSTLYDKNCRVICLPDGGISDKGDGKCPDFFTSRSDEKLIWEDERK